MEGLIWILLIPYCTIAYGIHGGEMYTGVNRQLRNLACALPFGVIGPLSFSPPLAYLSALVAFSLSYGGTSLGFDWFPSSGWKYYGGLAIKGLITCPLGGVVSLPFAYCVGGKTVSKNVFSEYFSGFLYGLILFLIKLCW